MILLKLSSLGVYIDYYVYFTTVEGLMPKNEQKLLNLIDLIIVADYRFHNFCQNFIRNMIHISYFAHISTVL